MTSKNSIPHDDAAHGLEDKYVKQGDCEPKLAPHRISAKKNARSGLSKRRVSHSTIRKSNRSVGLMVATISMGLAALVLLKVMLFPALDKGSYRIESKDGSRLIQSEDAPQQDHMPQELRVTIEDFSKSLFFTAGQNDFPTRLDVNVQGHEFPLELQYTLDQGLQTALAGWLDRYDPDFAVAVAIDPDSGRILALTTHVSDGEPMGNLAMSSAFPAASVFKIVTAAAALDLGKLNPQSVTPFNGKSTTLYKKNVFEHKNNKWTRKPTLSEAFSKSINTVFARIGLFTVGPKLLSEYANRFYFNARINSDITIDPSLTYIPSGDNWAVAEAASGYTNKVTLSPLHGAAVAASMINGGKLMRPYLVDNAYDAKGHLVYTANPQLLSSAISPQTALSMQTLMARTVSKGTARKSYRGFFKGQYSDLKVGGKTGTLSGGDLKGLNDWFVGYAYDDNKKLAFAILNINLEKWKVKSHYLSRLMIEHFFDSSADVTMSINTEQ